MKSFASISCLLISTIVVATPSDDLRHAIITSDLKQALCLLPLIPDQEKASFVQLADEILNKRHVDYEAHRVVPQISFPMAFCFTAGLTAYLACLRKFNTYGLNSKLISVPKFVLARIQNILDDPNVRRQLESNGVGITGTPLLSLLLKIYIKQKQISIMPIKRARLASLWVQAY